MTEYLTTREAADLVGLAEKYVRDLAREGRIVAVVKGRHYWIDRKSIVDYAERMKKLGRRKHNWRRYKDGYLTTSEAAEESGFTENYVRTLVRKEKVKAIYYDRQYWIEAEDLRRYIREMDELGTQRFNWRREDEQ